MEKFNNIFDKWIEDTCRNQVDAITKICDELEIDPTNWFKNDYLSYRTLGDFSGYDIINQMLDQFVFHIYKEFEKPLFKYVKPHGLNIYKKPYLALDLNLRYDDGFYFTNKKKVRKLGKTLTLEQKEDLMTDKLFSYIINKTNSEFFSRKEIRMLKLRKLNEFNKDIE